MSSWIWYLIFGIACLLNIIVSCVIAKRDDLERFQKVSQIIIVWLFPFIGAIGLWLFYLSDDHNTPSGGAFGGGASNSMDTSGGGD